MILLPLQFQDLLQDPIKTFTLLGTVTSHLFVELTAQENRQRAKHLTHETQIRERRVALHQIKLGRFRKLLALYDTEQKKYDENEICERKLVMLYKQYQNVHPNNTTGSNQEVVNTHSNISTPMYSSICNSFIYEMLQTFEARLSKQEMLVFVQVRSESVLRAGRISYLGIPKRKSEIFELLWKLHNVPVMPRKYPVCPLEPPMA